MRLTAMQNAGILSVLRIYAKGFRISAEADIVILGGPGEESLGRQICGMIGKNRVSLSAERPVSEKQLL